MTTTRCEGSTSYSIGPNYHWADDGDDGLCARCRQTMLDEEAKQLTKRVWQLYAQDRRDHFEHFYPSATQVRMCGTQPVFVVRVTKDDEGDYYAWYNSFHPANRSRKGNLSFVYRSPMLVEVCFTHGTAHEIRRGHGNVIRLRVEPICPAPVHA